MSDKQSNFKTNLQCRVFRYLNNTKDAPETHRAENAERPCHLSVYELEDEVMTLRAQVKVLQQWNRKAKGHLISAAQALRDLGRPYSAMMIEEIL